MASNKRLIEKCRRYQKLDDEIKDRELKKKQIQVELKKALEQKKVDELNVDIYHFSNKVVKGKTLFDTKSFAEKHPTLYKKFTTEGKETTRFSFNLIKQ